MVDDRSQVRTTVHRGRHSAGRDFSTFHMVMEFKPSLIGCYIWSKNYSSGLISKSTACVINIPTIDLAPTVVKIGNCWAVTLISLTNSD
jgi:flavin reductase (DIM6/NTAB) family NADH-FMN oxidoreductase RutF